MPLASNVFSEHHPRCLSHRTQPESHCGAPEEHNPQPFPTNHHSNQSGTSHLSSHRLFKHMTSWAHRDGTSHLGMITLDDLTLTRVASPDTSPPHPLPSSPHLLPGVPDIPSPKRNITNWCYLLASIHPPAHGSPASAPRCRRPQPCLARVCYRVQSLQTAYALRPHSRTWVKLIMLLYVIALPTYLHATVLRLHQTSLLAGTRARRCYCHRRSAPRTMLWSKMAQSRSSSCPKCLPRNHQSTPLRNQHSME
jgi:hypothetical protein